MGVKFRCENCGKLLDVDANTGQNVKCPHCHKKVAVPAGLASLPHPQAGGSPPPPPPRAAQGDASQDPEQLEPEEDGAAMTIMAEVMPWIFSVFFHLGLALVVFLVTKMLYEQPPLPDKLAEQERVAVPERQKTRSKVVDNQERSNSRRQARQSEKIVERARGIADVDLDTTGTNRPDAPTVIAPSGGGGTPGGRYAAYGPDQRGGGLGLKFLDTTMRGDHIVYVIDRSGSMASGGAFDILAKKLGESLADLRASQQFHLIFFGPDEPVEKSPRRLVPATDANKRAAAPFLGRLVPEGQTQVLPALKRAFEVFEAEPNEGKKLICLLSDGDFEGLGQTSNRYKGKTGNEAVVAWLADHNSDDDSDGRRDVEIQTFLYRGDDPDAVEVMKKIAAEHGGNFTHVTQ
ncbi:MAG: VWA domain-containing protein [Phycisphaerae bacterium]|nr:VWA domain-containing protein [Phycisphaerae bacterium]